MVAGTLEITDSAIIRRRWRRFVRYEREIRGARFSFVDTALRMFVGREIEKTPAGASKYFDPSKQPRG